MPRLAMYRDRHPRPDHLVHAHQLVPRRMTGDMDEMVLVGHDLDAGPDQSVVQPPDRLLVAGDNARGKDHDIAFLEYDIRMVVARDPRQGGARLALAAGADQQDLVARDVAGLVLGQEAGHIAEIAVL